MILGHHLILAAYGFWLPNDPRGSWSDFVGSWDLFRYGPATKTCTARSVAGNRHDTQLRLTAKKTLKFPAVRFKGEQARCVANAWADYACKSCVKIWACAILPEHMHLVVARQEELDGDQLITGFKVAATRRLLREKLHPLAAYDRDGETPPKVFAQGGWKVYLDSEEDLRRAIEYVRLNPMKEGLREQKWKFVTPFYGFV